jgi:TP901 family phage tail tape measure protein
MEIAISLIANDLTGGAFGSMMGNVGRARGLFGELGASFMALSDTMKGAIGGTVILGAAFVGLVDIEKNAISAAVDFQTSMNKIDLSVQGASENAVAMQHTLINLADSGIYSASQIADGFAQMGIDGFNATQIMNGMGQAGVYMGEAMRVETVPAFNLLASAMEMYGADASQATQFSNDLTFAFYNGQKTVANLQQAMNMVGPAAHQLHVPFGELSDVLALLGQSGLKGSQGASSLQYYLTNLASPTSKAAAELKALGVSAYDQNGNFIGLTQSIELLGPALSRLSEKDRNQAIANLFNIRSGRDAREFFANFVETINKLDALDKIRNHTTALEKANEVLNTAAAKWTQLGTTIQDSLKFLGAPILGPLAAVIDKVQQLFHSFNTASDAVHNNMAVWLLVGIVVLGIATIIGAAVIVWTLFSAAITAAVGPVLIFLGIVAAVIAVFLVLKTAIENNKTVMDIFNGAVKIIQQAFGMLKDQVMLLWNNLKLLAPVWEVLKVVLVAVAVIIGVVLVAAILIIIGVITAVVFIVRNAIQWFAAFGTIVGQIFSALGTFFSSIPGVVSAAWTAVQNKTTEIWNNITSAVGGFMSSIGSAIQSGMKFVEDLVNNSIKAIVGFFEWMYNHNYYFKDLVDAIKSAFTSAHAFVVSIWNSITSFLSSTWNSIRTTAGNAFNAVGTAIHSALTTAQGVVSNVANAIKSVLSAAWSAVSGAASAAWSHFVSIIQGAVGGATGAANGIKNGIMGVINSLGGALLGAGANAVHMLANGIAGAAGAVIAQAQGIANKVKAILGFHSPPPEGPLSDSDTYMPNMMKMYAAGIADHLPLITGKIGTVASALGKGVMTPSISGTASSGAALGVGVVQIPINLDGKQIAEYALDLQSRQLTMVGGSRYAR